MLPRRTSARWKIDIGLSQTHRRSLLKVPVVLYFGIAAVIAIVIILVSYSF